MMSPPYDVSFFYNFKDLNINEPNELLIYIPNQNKSSWRNAESVTKTNVLQIIKTNKTSTEQILSTVRSNLNKLSLKNGEVITKNITDIGITSDVMEEVMDMLIQKILSDTLYSSIYASLCVKLFVNGEDENIFKKKCFEYIDLTAQNKIKFDDNKIKFNNMIKFIIELSNKQKISSLELNNIFVILENNITKNDVFQLIESFCLLFKILSPKNKKTYTTHLNFIRKMEKNQNFPKKYLFLIMDLIESL